MSSDNRYEKRQRGLSVIVCLKHAYTFRNELKRRSYDDKNRTSEHVDSERIAIPVLNSFINEPSIVLTSTSSDDVTLMASDPMSLEALDDSTFVKISNSDRIFNFCSIPFTFKLLEFTKPRKSNKGYTKMHERLVSNMSKLLDGRGMLWTDDLAEDLPKNWEIHGNLLMISSRDCFTNDVWKQFGSDLWESVSSALNCTRVALKGAILNSDFRAPSVKLVLGEDGWVEHTDNRVKYVYNVERCMFSAGNITEKLRISKFKCAGETIVDLYAGIGYFTLPYLVHAGASFVYACEWNPDAVEALEKSLHVNGVEDRCRILKGDNKITCPRGVADRVNLGLIPSSAAGWAVACAALRNDRGGVLHIHTNVTRAKKQSPTDERISMMSEENEAISIQNLNRRTEILNDRVERDCCTTDIGIVCTNVKHDNILNPNMNVNKLKSWSTEEAMKSSGGGRIRDEWRSVAEQTRCKIKEMLSAEHARLWSARVIHVERVKSYAPHIDHVVIDIECVPSKPDD